jgi:hypothetical protein
MRYSGHFYLSFYPSSALKCPGYFKPAPKSSQDQLIIIEYQLIILKHLK